MVKVFALMTALICAIVVACGGPKTTTATTPPTDKTITPTSSGQENPGKNDADGSKQTGESSKEETQGDSNKSEILGKIEITGYHLISRASKGAGLGLCTAYAKKMLIGKKMAEIGPCPDSLKVGDKKVTSKIAVACPQKTLDGVSYQDMWYDNVWTVRANSKNPPYSSSTLNTEKLTDLIPIKTTDSIKSVCEKILKSVGALPD